MLAGEHAKDLVGERLADHGYAREIEDNLLELVEPSYQASGLRARHEILVANLRQSDRHDGIAKREFVIRRGKRIEHRRHRPRRVVRRPHVHRGTRPFHAGAEQPMVRRTVRMEKEQAAGYDRELLEHARAEENPLAV